MDFQEIVVGHKCPGTIARRKSVPRGHVKLPKEFGVSPRGGACSGVTSSAIILLGFGNYLICFNMKRALSWRSHDTHSTTPTTIPQPLGLIIACGERLG